MVVAAAAILVTVGEFAVSALGMGAEIFRLPVNQSVVRAAS